MGPESGSPQTIDLVAASASELQSLLTTGTLTSSALVTKCFQQIQNYDRQGPNSRSMISIVPEAQILRRAHFLDEERRAGRTLRPLHGIPIILKDIIDTHPDMGLPTTGGAWAMASSQSATSSLLVEKLLAAGMIIIGKTNLSSELPSKGPKGRGGLSGLGGQAQSAYIECGVIDGEDYFGDSSPGGSSTGSAVGVSAGYSPISIGGEGNGSIQTPASRAALYALKCTPESLSCDGIFLVSPSFETLGGMAKTVEDLYEITKMILLTANEPVDLQIDRSKTWKEFSVGFVDPALWRLPEGPGMFTPTEKYKAQIWEAYKGAMNKTSKLGGTVHYPVSIPHPSEFSVNETTTVYQSVTRGEMRNSVNSYLEALQKSDVRSLAEIIQFNNDHSELQAGIGQDWLVVFQNDSQPPEAVAETRAMGRTRAGKDGIFKKMAELGLDVICSCSDGPISTISALAGCPTGTVPLGMLEPSGRPFGLTFVAKPGEEGKLLEVMSAFEATFPKRELPPLVRA